MSEQPALLPLGDAPVPVSRAREAERMAAMGEDFPSTSGALVHRMRRARPPKPPISTFAVGERVAVCVDGSDEATEILSVIRVLARLYVVGASESDPCPLHYSRTTLRQKHTLGDVRIRKYRDGDESAVVLRELRQRRKEANAALGNAESACDAACRCLQRARDDVAMWQEAVAAREIEANGKAAAVHALDAEIATMTEAP